MPSSAPSPSSLRQLDHGRSWCVLLGAFLIGGTALSNGATMSTLYKAVVIHVKTTSGEEASKMSLVVLFALIVALNLMGGAVATFVIPLIGYRLTMATGAFLAMLGFGCSAVATRVWHLYLTWGVLTGLGFGITYTPANGVLGYYFSPKVFSYAGSVASTGVAAGIVAFSYIHPGLTSHLSWPAAMLVEAALCGLLFSSALAVREADINPPRATPVLTASLGQQLSMLTGIANKLHVNSTTPISLVMPPTASITASAVFYKSFAFYMMLIEGTGQLVMNFFFVLTPVYLISAQGWHSSQSVAYIFIVFGATALATRVGLNLFNFFGDFARRVPITPQVGVGLVLLTATSIAYLAAPTLVGKGPVIGAVLSAANQAKNVTNFSVANVTNVSSPSTVSLMQEHNALLFIVFAAVLGCGATLFNGYQVRLLFDVVPKECLTAAFACQNMVLGVLQLALCPVPALLANNSGTVRLGYLVCLGFGVVSMTALVAVVVMIRRTKIKQALVSLR